MYGNTKYDNIKPQIKLSTVFSLNAVVILHEYDSDQ